MYKNRFLCKVCGQYCSLLFYFSVFTFVGIVSRSCCCSDIVVHTSCEKKGREVRPWLFERAACSSRPDIRHEMGSESFED